MISELGRLGGVTIYELKERFSVSARTIRRDLDALAEAGLLLEGDEEERDGKKKRWRLDMNKQAAKFSDLLDVTHYLALRVTMGQNAALATKSWSFASLEDLADKIEKAVGPKGREKLKAIEAAFLSYDKFAYREAAKEYFWPLIDAISGQRVCTVTYAAPRPKPKDATYDILPLRLFVHDRAVYLICQFMSHKRIGTLNLHRLKALKVLDRTAAPPTDFDPAKYENSAFGIHPSEKETTYVLRFDKEAAPYIRERVWHPSQELRDLRGGAVQLTFTCGESHEVMSWVASWTEWVVVAEPGSLRRALNALGAWLQETYGEARPK